MPIDLNVCQTISLSPIQVMVVLEVCQRKSFNIVTLELS